MNEEKDIPPDPYLPDIDPVGFALERLQTHLIWIEEHRASSEQFRHEDASSAETELSNLKFSIEEAVNHLQRLSELLSPSLPMEPGKRLPKGLSNFHWLWFAKAIRERRG